MEAYIGPRQSGKTTELVDELRNDSQGLLLVPNQRMKHDAQRRFPDVKERIVTIHDLTGDAGREMGKRRLYVDEVGLFLGQLTGHYVQAIAGEGHVHQPPILEWR
jgi:hypothetical protein